MVTARQATVPQVIVRLVPVQQGIVEPVTTTVIVLEGIVVSADTRHFRSRLIPDIAELYRPVIRSIRLTVL